MYPVMKNASRWNGYLFCGLLVVMMVYSIPQLVTFASTEEETLSLYLDGQLSRKFEQRFDGDLPFKTKSISFWSDIRYVLFNEGESGVVVGRDDWLYSNEELLIPNKLDEVLSGHLAKIKSINDELKLAGRDLIIVPVPLKAAIYPEHLKRPLDARLSGLYQKFLDDLKNSNIKAVPLDLTFNDYKAKNKSGAPLYLARDTHWSPAGANLAAQAVAQMFPDLVEGKRYQSATHDTTDYQGDLTNFVLAGNWLAGSIRAPEVVPVYETVPIVDENSPDALFGDVEQSIDLVGTSYSEIEAWNFRGFLQQSLARDVTSFSLKEKGPFVSMSEYMESELSASDSASVIWEFPVRVLLMPDERVESWQEALKNQF
ncbi:alginate O-acetyltransferase AlgX-related protein [Gilvimarinus agarilyticus]|uniref:alginate O-acetyltransferase AlgX-related protein n=1 Tax=Gilvimarinus agarilyticus TaxID=679259 RepID=UPI0005A2F4C5|nr:hypothetical protein [Gilvimarinus agarilyticus]